MLVLPPDSSGIAKALEALRDGLVVAHATETCYGLACDLVNPEAVARLFRIKQRPETQPVSALFSSIDQAKQYLVWNNRAEELVKEFLPGPLTIILPLRADAPMQIFPNPVVHACESRAPTPPYMRAAGTHLRITPLPTLNSQLSTLTIGLRLSPHPVAQAIAEQFGRPVSTTSANLHGQPNPYSVDEILAQYKECDAVPDLILDSGPLERRAASRIIDLSGTSENILRP